jgi:hypothetical protein
VRKIAPVPTDDHTAAGVPSSNVAITAALEPMCVRDDDVTFVVGPQIPKGQPELAHSGSSCCGGAGGCGASDSWCDARLARPCPFWVMLTLCTVRLALTAGFPQPYDTSCRHVPSAPMWRWLGVSLNPAAVASAVEASLYSSYWPAPGDITSRPPFFAHSIAAAPPRVGMLGAVKNSTLY